MEFRSCCCLKPRTGALIAGAVDLVLGILGIMSVVSLHLGYFDTSEHGTGNMTDTSTTTTDKGVKEGVPVVTESAIQLPQDKSPDTPNEQTNYYEDHWNAAMYLYAFASISSAAHGLLTLLAAMQKNSFLIRAALGQNLFRILGLIGGSVVIFILGYHWHIITPIPLVLILAGYFFWVDYDFHKYFAYTQTVNTKPRA